jgi:choline kinase
MKSQEVKGLILAAGRGSRMNDLTSDYPKCFTELAGKRLINWQLESFQKANITDIAIVTGYLSERFNEYDLIKFNNEKWNKTNMVSSLLEASSFIDTHTIVSYSDIVFHKNAIKNILMQEGDIVLGYDQNWLSQWKLRFEDPRDDGESFHISKNNLILDIGNKINEINKIKGQYIGLFKITPNGMKRIQRTLNDYSGDKSGLDMTALFQLMIKDGIEIFGSEIQSDWFEIDTPTDLNIAESLYNSNQLKIS